MSDPQDGRSQTDTGIGIASTWGADLGESDELPSGFVSHLLHRPDESLQEMLAAVERQGRSTRASVAFIDVGTVRRIGDGVASVWGLPQATTDELLRFTGGVMGLVMNLDADWIDCILLGSDEGIQGGAVVWSTGQRFRIPVGDRLLGRVMTPLGAPIDGKGRIYVDERRFIERQAPGVIERESVTEPLNTGIKAIDAIVPIGRGQRELIIGDRQTGKTTIALDTIINQKDEDVLCVYVSIGQRKSAALQAINILEQAGALEHTVVVLASPDDPPALLYLAPYAGCTIAEAFLDHGRDVLIIYDDLTKHADAYRELSLLLRRPPGREAYPGDIFYLHSRLLERACRLSEARGGGSITALPIVETRRGNIQAYIPTNLISITDGQIYLSPELFNQNIKPAIDVGLSVSRVGGAAQTPIMRSVSGQLKLSLAQYEEVSHFARFGAEIDRATRQLITRGTRLREVLKQPAYSPLALAQQVLILYAAGHGYLDDLPEAEIAQYEKDLWQYAQREYRGIIRRIVEQKALDDELERDMVQLMDEFTGSFARRGAES
ncbi:MAG: F0F1 ATP synthase subunit alpha [Chloroflexi bacterium]|nr:F0F1 ATP synthase subunit alpha [Chloroflexota bacterium]